MAEKIDSVGISELFRQRRNEHWRRALVWLLYSLGGALLPFLFSTIWTLLSAKPFSAADYARNGEFAILSASIILPAFYVVVRDKAVMWRGNDLGVALMLIVLVPSIFLYCFMKAQAPEYWAPTGPTSRAKDAVLVLSVVVFAASSAGSFLIQLLDEIRSDFDPQQTIRGQEQTLSEKFDGLKK